MTGERNYVRLIGFLGSDPEVKNSAGGKKFVKLQIATNETRIKDGEKVTETTWHNLTGFGYVADRLERVKKGNEVVIEGKISSRTYEDTEGSKRTVFEVIVNDVMVLNNKVLKEA